MRHSTTMIKPIIAFLFFTSAPLLAAPKPTTKPAATRPASARANAAQSPDAKAALAINNAVAALVKEFQTNQKDPVTPLRKESNFFEKFSDASDVTPEAILNALDRQQNPDPRIDAYVKWQLLSAIKPKFDIKLAQRALNVYQHAPHPAPRPGLDESEQRQLRQSLPNRADSETADDINREWKERVFRTAQANLHILRYREELFEKLPPSLQTFRLALQDAYMRVMNGFSSDKFVEQICTGIREWSREASAPDMLNLADLLGGLQDQMTGKNPKSPEYLSQVHFDEKGQKIVWDKGRAYFAKDKDLEELAQFLRNRAQNAAAKGKK